MPFQNLSGDRSKDYFAEGMTTELISALTRADGIRVASRTSVYALQAAGMDLRSVGEQLGAPLVIMGSVQWIERRIRVTVELVQVSDLYNVWSETFSRPAEDVFSIQERIADTVVRRLQPHLSQPGTALVKRYTQNVRAYNDYLRGLHAWNLRTFEGMQEAIAHYQSALDAETQYALPLAGMADVYLAISQFQHRPPRDVLSKAEVAARQAVGLDPKLSQALASMGHVHELLHWNDRTAEHYYRRALEENPDYATAHAWLSDMLMLLGRVEESLAHSARAIHLEPFSIPIAFEAANLRYRMRQYEEAEERNRLIMKQAPNFAMARVFLVFSLIGQGKSEQAVETAREALSAVGSAPILEMAYGYALGRVGRRDEAEALMLRQEERRREEFVPALNTALVRVALGDNDVAFEWLEKAYEERSVLMLYLRTDAYLDPIRSDPRFDALMERVGYGRRPIVDSAASTVAASEL
jgi:serine/threonine-protein kinase